MRNMLGHIRKVICSTSLAVICIISLKWQNNIWIYFYICSTCVDWYTEIEFFIICTKFYDSMMKSSKMSADGRDVHVLLTNVMWKNVQTHTYKFSSYSLCTMFWLIEYVLTYVTRSNIWISTPYIQHEFWPTILQI